MRYVEFLVFISRVAHEIYIGTNKQHKGLHLKIDAILKPLLNLVGEVKTFSLKKEDAISLPKVKK